MYKLLFEILVSPLNLPINCIYEYLILLFVGEIAYKAAFRAVGNLIGDGLIPDKKVARIMHWVIRLAIYVIIWVILRSGIDLYFLIFG